MVHRSFRTSSWLTLILSHHLLFSFCTAAYHYAAPQSAEEAPDRGRGAERRAGSLAQQFSKKTSAALGTAGHSLHTALVGGRSEGPSYPSRPHQLPPGSPVPRYVLDLYDKVRSGQLMDQPDMGNTVRSIPAAIGEVKGTAMFLFNLSSITTTERLLRVHLHLYQRKSNCRKLCPDMRRDREVVLYHVDAAHGLRQTGSINVTSEARGWQRYSVTDAVLSCVMTDRAHPHALAFTVRDPTPDSTGIRQSVLKQFVLGRNSLPFLVLFSHETKHVLPEGLGLVAEKLQRGLHHSDSEQLGLWDKGFSREEDGDANEELGTEEHPYTESFYTSKSQNRNVNHRFGYQSGNKNKILHKLPDTTNIDTLPKILNSSASVTKLHVNQRYKDQDTQRDVVSLLAQRKKRSIFTNKIPTHPPDYSKDHHHYNLPSPNLVPITARNKPLEQNQTMSHWTRRAKTERNPRQFRRNKHKSSRQRRKNQAQGLLHPQRWSTDTGHTADPTADPKQSHCTRKQLFVNFADMGWGDWIISPKSFEAYYCSGSCPLRLAKRLQSSNHATLQSIIYAMGYEPKLPPPCCVPHNLTSLTLLYFDRHHNVVLKNYPGMIVQSCACR